MKYFFAVFLLYFCSATTLSAQNETTEIPIVEIRTLTGEVFNTAHISNDGPIFLSFWATWCRPCIRELMTLDEHYYDWQEETGLKIYAVSIDDSKSSNRVAPFVNGRGWEFEVLLDVNSDFKRAMNVVNIPHSFILDKDGKIVWQHTSFSPGDELEIYKILQELSAQAEEDEELDEVEDIENE